MDQPLTTTKMGLLDASNFYILDVFIKKTSSMNYVKEKTSNIVLKNMKFSRFFLIIIC